LLVGRFGIKSKTVWAKGRKKNDTTGSGKGYEVADFKKAWAKYDPEGREADTPDTP
jgi:hypothetical protein